MGFPLFSSFFHDWLFFVWICEKERFVVVSPLFLFFLFFLLSLYAVLSSFFPSFFFLID